MSSTGYGNGTIALGLVIGDVLVGGAIADKVFGAATSLIGVFGGRGGGSESVVR